MRRVSLRLRKNGQLSWSENVLGLDRFHLPQFGRIACGRDPALAGSYKATKDVNKRHGVATTGVMATCGSGARARDNRPADGTPCGGAGTSAALHGMYGAARRQTPSLLDKAAHATHDAEMAGSRPERRYRRRQIIRSGSPRSGSDGMVTRPQRQAPAGHGRSSSGSAAQVPARCPIG